MLPEDCSKQWEILLLLIASEEKKIDRTNDNEIDTMNYFLKNEGVKCVTYFTNLSRSQIHLLSSTCFLRLVQ